jgi:hypothetical protein
MSVVRCRWCLSKAQAWSPSRTSVALRIALCSPETSRSHCHVRERDMLAGCMKENQRLKSRARIHEERAMRRRHLKRLWGQLGQLAAMRLKRGDFADEAQRRTSQVAVLASPRHRDRSQGGGVQLSAQLRQQIEALIFIAFLAYCLRVTVRARLRPLAARLTPRAALDKLAAIQMLDVHFPTTDGRTLILNRYTEPNANQRVLPDRLRLTLPSEPPPRITAAGHVAGPGLRM